MEEFRRAGKTILLVTHDLAVLQGRCDEAAWLDAGVLKAYGDPAFVVSEYRKAVAESEVQAETAPGPSVAVPLHPTGRQPRAGPPAEAGRRWGTFEAEVVAVHLRNPGGADHAVFDPDDGLEAAVEVAADPSLARVSVEVSLFAVDGTLLWRGSQRIASAPVATATLSLDRLGLADGNYRLDVAVFADDGRVCCDFHKGLHGFAVRSTGGSVGLVRPLHRWTVDPALPPDQGR
jgi:lipopolysaccharide transport system ATP-binding protein